MKKEIRKILDEHDVEKLTAKSVRQKLEEMMGLASGALKPKKQEISDLIDECIEEQDAEEGKIEDQGKDGEEEEQEEEEEPPPKKKAKRSGKAAAGNDADNGTAPAKPKMTCRTKSGKECPKNIKALQEKLKITSKAFLGSQTLEIDLAGNSLTGEPRVFSSGNLGWYLGGKCEMNVAKKTVWAQVGINITIPGSNTWK